MLFFRYIVSYRLQVQNRSFFDNWAQFSPNCNTLLRLRVMTINMSSTCFYSVVGKLPGYRITVRCAFLPVLPIKLVKSDLQSHQIGLTLQRLRFDLREMSMSLILCQYRIDFKK